MKCDNLEDEDLISGKKEDCYLMSTNSVEIFSVLTIFT